MAKLPTVAIIGRPNTGKSTLFNRLVGRNKAIISDTAGTTRDHIAHRIEEEEVDYLLVDTGGMGGGTDDKELEDDVHRQSLLALENADLILFTLNSREELTSSDFEIASTLRKSKKKHVPVIIALTKCDNPSDTEEILPQFYQLSNGEDIVPISAPHKLGVDELRAKIISHLLDLHFTKQDRSHRDGITKVAIIGKPNVGKSSIVNALMNESALKESPILVSDIAGTTRDTVDMTIKFHDQEFIFMDTAGIKKRSQTPEGIETYAYFRSIRALEQSDIAILVIDATAGVSKQEKKIAGLATEEGKGLIILMNKWDLVEKEDREYVVPAIKAELAFCRFASFIPCSASTKEGLLKIFKAIDKVQVNRSRRIGTKDLLQWFSDVTYGQPMGQLAKSKHITQADEVPPTFVIFVKDPKKVQPSQLRYLDNRMRELFDFEGTPIKWLTKGGQKD